MPTLVSIPDGLKINKIEFFHEGDDKLDQYLTVQFKDNGVGTYHHIRMDAAGWSSDEYENVALAKLINSIARHNDHDTSRMTKSEPQATGF